VSKTWSSHRITPTRALGVAAFAGVAGTVWLGLFVTPPDVFQGQLVRLLYVHPPVAWVAYLAFGVSAAASALWLWRRTRSELFDRLAAASVEVGVVFAALTLVTGSIWARPTWGLWWTWDARLTSTALLFVLYLGYLALRRVPGTRDARARRSAVAAIVAFADVPISYLSVYWWRTLHQTGTVLDPKMEMHVHGSMAWTLLLGFCSFTLVYVWMLVQRYRIEALEDGLGQGALAAALEERRREAAEGGHGAGLVLAGPVLGEAGLDEPPAGSDPAGERVADPLVRS
jgi:heme exporter protein C